MLGTASQSECRLWLFGWDVDQEMTDWWVVVKCVDVCKSRKCLLDPMKIKCGGGGRWWWWLWCKKISWGEGWWWDVVMNTREVWCECEQQLLSSRVDGGVVADELNTFYSCDDVPSLLSSIREYKRQIITTWEPIILTQQPHQRSPPFLLWWCPKQTDSEWIPEKTGNSEREREGSRAGQSVILSD